MKTINWYVTIFTLMLCSIFFSCGDDNEDSLSEETSTELDNESQAIINKYKDTRSLIGEWEYAGYGKSDFRFASDGRCFMRGSMSGDFYTEGVWNYDTESRLLSTTCGSWAWTVNLLTEREWSGISPGGNAFSYKRRYNWNDPNDELLVGKWVNEEQNAIVIFYADQRYKFSIDNTVFNGTYEVTTIPVVDSQCDYRRVIDLVGDLYGKMYVGGLDGYMLNISSCIQGAIQFEMDYIYSDFLD
ncbi:hypothetical protein H8S77_00870 [Parabacteroides sp. BX2]|jgi:hypothetical protein|uniref:Uncharacterized protein n=1 Tax=Parabacteroides segnis TaxID=2763058 RepID=A0ABR7DVD5_9BACT|nr:MULTISPECIES: hypothetical protein [Parabacteroides]MBC5641441.1 hypothetical protein [Parabacteroides segnis]MCM0711188.1 hypothetical protein [Parabacteroides sp. TA-V-105]